MNINQAISFANSYLAENMKIIEITYEKIQKLFLFGKGIDPDEHKTFKTDYQKKVDDIDKLFDKAKRDRPEFVQAMNNLKENKNAEEVRLGTHNFYDYLDRMKKIKTKHLEKLMESMDFYLRRLEQDINDDSEETNYTYKLSRLKIVRAQADRLDGLLESNINHINDIKTKKEEED